MINVIQKRKDAAGINDVNKTSKSVQIVPYIGGARVEKEIRKYLSVSKYFKLSDNCPKIRKHGNKIIWWSSKLKMVLILNSMICWWQSD